MKKLICYASALFVSVVGSHYVNAQEEMPSSGFYGALNIEYGVGMNLDQLGIEERVFMAPHSILPNTFVPSSKGPGASSKPILGTVGSGITIKLTPGYMFSKHIGIELGLNYFMSSETTMSEITSDRPDLYGDKTTSKSNQFRVIPSLVFSTGDGPIFGFAKVGIVVPAGGKTEFKRNITQPVFAGGTDENGNPLNPSLGQVGIPIVAEGESKGKFSLGFRGSVGAGYVISDNLSLSLEVFYTSLGIKSKTRTVKSFKQNGAEIIGTSNPQGSVYATQTEYVDELTSTSNNLDYNDNINPNAPKQDIGTRGNYSQVGLSIGVKYRF